MPYRGWGSRQHCSDIAESRSKSPAPGLCLSNQDQPPIEHVGPAGCMRPTLLHCFFFAKNASCSSTASAASALSIENASHQGAGWCRSLAVTDPQAVADAADRASCVRHELLQVVDPATVREQLTNAVKAFPFWS
jgi:hypothetical protein